MNILHQTFRLHPQISSGVVGFVVFGLGDVLSQTTERRKENNNSNSSNNNVDYVRTMQTGTLGVVMNGVILHHWYRSLDYTFGRGMKTNSRGVMFKTVADQLIYAPFAITMFFGYVSTMKALHGPTTCTASSGGNEISNAIDNGSDNVSNHPMTTSSPSIPSMAMSSFQQQMEKYFVSTYVADLCVWPMVNILNFRYVPLHYRPSFIGVVQIAWQAYLSRVSHTQPVR